MTDSRILQVLSSTIVRPYGVCVPFDLCWFSSKYELLTYAKGILGSLTKEEREYLCKLYLVS